MAIPGISGIHFKYTVGGGILQSFKQRVPNMNVLIVYAILNRVR